MPGPHTSPLVPIGPNGGAPATAAPPPTAGEAAVEVAGSGAPVWLQGPSGAPVKVDPLGAAKLMGMGFVQMDPAAVAQIEAADKHRGLLSTLGAAGLGVAETLAPVVGPAALDATGAYPYEDQLSLSKAHPIAKGAGQFVGAVAPAIATLGGSAPASAAGVAAAGTGAAVRAGAKQALKASAPEVLSALGAKVGAAVETSVGANTLGRITGAATNAAVQSAGFAATDWANRRVQGDPKATGEQLFHQTAAAVLFGAPLGALGGAMTKVANSHAADFVSELRDLEARGGLKATGAIQGLLTKWEKQVGPERLRAIGTMLGREGGVGKFKSFDEMLELAETRFKGPAAADMEAILQNVQGHKKAWGFVDDLHREIFADPRIQKWANNPLDKEAYGRFVGKMNDVFEKYTVRNPDGTVNFYKGMSPATLHELSQQFAAEARGWGSTMTDPARGALASAFDHARYVTNGKLEKLLEAAAPAGPGQAGLAAAWKEAKFRYQAGLFLEDGATQGLNRSWGNNQVSPLETIGSMTGAITGGAPGAAMLGVGVGVVRREGAALQNEGARRLGDFIEKLQSKSGEQIAEGIKRIFSNSASQAAALVSEARERHRITPENYAEMAGKIYQAANDPEHVAKQIGQSFGPLIEGQGDVALALQTTASAAAQHLAGQLPDRQRTGPLDHDYVPSASELANINRHWTAMHAPESILNRIADGSFTSEDAAALTTVYPAGLPAMKAQVAEALADALAKKQVIPAEARIGLGQFLGVELSSRATGQTIASVQAAYQSMAQKPQGKPPSKVDFHGSDQYSTERQASQDRMRSA